MFIYNSGYFFCLKGYGIAKVNMQIMSPVVTICTTSLTSAIIRSAHTVYLYILCVSQNKQRLFPYTALNDWFL
jgi:hypothetical protein